MLDTNLHERMPEWSAEILQREWVAVPHGREPKWRSMHPLAPQPMLGCFPNCHRFRRMRNSFTRSAAPVASAIAEKSMIRPILSETAQPVGRSLVNYGHSQIRHRYQLN